MKTFQTYVFEKLKLNSQSKLKSKKQYFPKNRKELQEICDTIIENTPDGQICDLNAIDTSQITNMKYLFRDIKNRSLLNKLDVSNWDVSNVTNMEQMFNTCFNLTYIGNLKNWNTKKVSNMEYMFSGCHSLTQIEGIEHWNMENVMNLSGMFSNCQKLQDIGNIGKWKFKILVSLQSTFIGCTSLIKLDLSNWNVSTVKYFGSMFTRCNKLEDLGDLGKWNFNTPTISISSMFNSCTNLKHIGDISNWNVQNAVAINTVFYLCQSLKDVGDLTKWKFNNNIDHDLTFDKSPLPYKYWNKRIIRDRKK